MPDPERDDEAEQAPRNEEKGQEHQKFPALHRHNEIRVPNSFIGIVSAYVGFVGIVIGFGVLAFYTGHKITQDITFFICIILLLPLFLLIPFSIFWYLRPIFKKNRQQNVTPEKQSLVDRFSRTFVGKFLFWLSNNRIGRILSVALYVYNIAQAILMFPRHPRSSLGLLVLSLAVLMWFMFMVYLETIEKRIDRRIDLLWKSTDSLWESVERHRDVFNKLLDAVQAVDKRHTDNTNTLAENFTRYLKDMSELMPIQREAEAAQSTALRAIHTLVLALNDEVNLLKEPPSENGEEPENDT